MVFSQELVWNYFLFSLGDLRKELIDFVSTSLNLFSGAECPTSLDTSLEFRPRPN
jgi:hypothetical protein